MKESGTVEGMTAPPQQQADSSISPWIQQLSALSAKPSRRIAGVMSGTSVDSIDVAICSILGSGPSASVVLSSLYTHKYPADLQARVRALKETTIKEVSELHLALGRLFGEAVNEAIAASTKNKLESLPVDLIGCHGQTVYHHSRQGMRSTLQLGSGEAVAEVTGLPVVFDFRARDVAAGGEGAPLTPYADSILFRASDESKAVLNLGGIANITLLSPDTARIFGFDCGPANAPLDRLARILSRGSASADVDGAWARAGTVNHRALKSLLDEDSFVNLPPPKSTGFEMYGDGFVQRLISLHEGGIPSNDCLATAVEFVVHGIGRAVELSKRDPKELIIAGGGLRNPFLIERLRSRLPNIDLVGSDKYRVPPEAREAMAFALFANEWLMGTAVSQPAITGLCAPRMLGSFAQGKLAE